MASVAPLLVAPAATAEPAGVATEPSVLQCASSAPIYTVRANGDLFLYQHLEPETGLNSWAPQQQIRTGLLGMRSFAGPNGVIYSAVDNGELRRRRWNGTGWDTFPGGAQYEVIDTDPGWARYVTPEYRNRITADTEGHIYTIEPDGNLHWRSNDAATRTWTHRVVDGGWNQYDLIVAAGTGVLYARDGSGGLNRYRYHAASQRLTISPGARRPDWQVFSRVFSAGGDILYSIRADAGHEGELHWSRFNEDTDTWAPGSGSAGKLVGTGWQNEFTTFAAPDGCQRVGTTVPTRPQVNPQPNAPVALLRATNGHVHYTYVDTEGRAAHAEVTDLTGGSPAGVAAVPGFTGVTGLTSTAENQNGCVQIVARGLDSEIRTNVQTAVSAPWGATTTLGGFMNSSSTIVRMPDNTLAMFAVDEAGGLWTRRQIGANGPTTAWRPTIRLGQPPGGCPVGGPCICLWTPNRQCPPPPPLSGEPLTVVPVPGGVRVIARAQNGHYQTAMHHTNGGWSRWAIHSGTGMASNTSAVLLPDNTVQIFTTGSDGIVQTRNHATATGFWGAGTTIPGVIASGPPYAIMAPDGTLQVVVRATDGYIYHTGQTAPGSGTFNPWREITNYAEESSTDPTALTVPESNTWVIAYRTDLDAPRLRRHQPSAAGALDLSSAAHTFADVPLLAPRP